MVERLKDLMSKEKLESITLPFRLIGPAITILIFFFQIGFGVFWFYFRKADDQSNRTIQIQMEQIKENTMDIKQSVRDLTLTVGKNDQYVHDWRITVEKELQKAEDREKRLAMIEQIVYKRGGIR